MRGRGAQKPRLPSGSRLNLKELTSAKSYKRPAATALVLMLAATPLFEGVGIFGRYEGFASALTGALKPAASSRVVVIEIRAEAPGPLPRSAEAATTGKDGVRCALYEKTSQSESPTGSAQVELKEWLPKLIVTLVRAAADAGAERIGVDVNTSAPEFAALAGCLADVPVIWGRPAEYSYVKRAFYVDRVLGGEHPPQSGLTVVAADGDEVVRRYRHNYQKADAVQYLPSFVAAMAGRTSADEREFLIDFREWTRKRLSADEFLGAGDGNGAPGDAAAKRKEWAGGKIVLIGGALDAADEHRTPLGWKSGADILADAIDTELAGPTRAPAGLLTFSLSMAAAYLVWKIFRGHRPGGKRLAAGVAVLAIFAFSAGRMAYGSFAAFTYFAPIMAVLGGKLAFAEIKERKNAKEESLVRAR